MGRSTKRITHLGAAVAGLWLVLAGCTYRFTNEHIVRPEGIRSIAVEAVYDTSREVLPHEQLWQALQDAFAADGHLELAPQKSADALLRAHLREAAIAPHGSEERNGPENDPSLDARGAPPRVDAFRPLTQAGEFRELGRLTMLVDVEVWSLRTRTLLLRRTYPLRPTFRAVHAASGVTTRANDHLRYDESVAAAFKSASESLAQRVVQDLLVQ